MFNSKIKKESIKNLESCIAKYDDIIENTKTSSLELFKLRMKAVKMIEIIEQYINTIANTPKTFEKEINEINLIINNFNEELSNIEYEAKKVEVVSGSIVGAGVVAGAGVFAYAPTAALAIATTFGTASTGTAIASLSGAAATNAALAWLGGGSLIVGGGGIAAGNALLALSGPIGWTIGASALAGSAIFSNQKNKKIAKEASKKTIEVKEMITKFQLINYEITKLYTLTQDSGIELIKMYDKLSNTSKTDFNSFTSGEQYELGVLVNNTKSYAKLLNKVVDC